VTPRAAVAAFNARWEARKLDALLGGLADPTPDADALAFAARDADDADASGTDCGSGSERLQSAEVVGGTWRILSERPWVRNARDYPCERCGAIVAEHDYMTVTTYRYDGAIYTERRCAQVCTGAAPEHDWKRDLCFSPGR
jgi:hypothetical protein